MRNMKSFILGFLCGSFIFGGTAVLANSDVLAKITSQSFFWNNEGIELEAYNINGYNYVRLRDAAAVFGVDVAYDEETNQVLMGTPIAETVPVQTIDGMAHAKEDYALSANPDVFNDIYTKEAYNAIRQSIVDIEEIVSGTDENGYNANYTYASFIDPASTFQVQGRTDVAMKSVVSAFSGYYTFSFGYEPTVKNLYEYPGYRICMPQVHTYFEPANKATDNFVAEISGLTDKEQVKRIADYICDRVVYKDENVAGINDIFTAPHPVNGICGTYAAAFVYLCQRADISCITVQDAEHAWNEIYVDGRWYVTDIGYYDIARTESALFPLSYPRSDPNTAKTKFAKELLVPMSTK